MLAPLSAGSHTIHFIGALTLSVANGDPFDLDFRLDISYHLTLAPGSREGGYARVTEEQAASAVESNVHPDVLPIPPENERFGALARNPLDSEQTRGRVSSPRSAWGEDQGEGHVQRIPAIKTWSRPVALVNG